MSLAQGLLSWPQEVAQQVHAALFLPAAREVFSFAALVPIQ